MMLKYALQPAKTKLMSRTLFADLCTRALKLEVRSGPRPLQISQNWILDFITDIGKRLRTVTCSEVQPVRDTIVGFSRCRVCQNRAAA